MTHRCEIVIPTRDRPGRLSDCLASLARQTERDIGVIVVDDCSDRPLDDVVASARTAGLDVKLVRLSTPSGPAAARNAGAALVQSEFVMFIDDDVRADPRLVEVHLGHARVGEADRPDVVSCGPFVEPENWSPTPWNKWEALQMRKEHEQLQRGDFDVTWRQFHTGNNCLPISTFRALGGFDESFKRAEDDEFALRLADSGCRFVFAADAIAWHYAHRSLESWLAIPRAYALHDVQMDRLHPESRHLDARKWELGKRHRLIRVARWLPIHTGLAPATIKAWVWIGRALFRAHLTGASMWALSAAYDLGYADALRQAENAAALPRTGDRPSAAAS
jgi:GT2 family glycosyltransferase